MTLSRGRVLRAEAAEPARPVALPRKTALALGRALPPAVVDAAQSARDIVTRAQARAEEIIAAAERDAARLRLQAEAAGRADAAASVAAHALSLRTVEARADERALERSIELARLLAERVLGAELRLNPARIFDLARQALSEARGARRIVILANADDAGVLQNALSALDLDADVQVQIDVTRARGSLRLETELGALDAELAPQLDRLVDKLRESLAR